MRRSLGLFLVVLGAVLPAIAQDAPLFPGAQHLDGCVVDLPLTYAKKDKDRYTQAARFLEDQELVLATKDKQGGTWSFQHVFVVVDAAKDGGEYVYLERAADRMRLDGMKEALFTRFRPAKDRFYNADCFDTALEAHPELREVLVPVP